MQWIYNLIFGKQAEECDHIFWPTTGPDGKYTGQQCSLCGHFNPIETIIPDYH